MNSHLSDEQLVASALGESDRVATLHLQECAPCREEIESLNGSIGSWVEDVRGASGASEVFWRRQREAIAHGRPPGSARWAANEDPGRCAMQTRCTRP